MNPEPNNIILYTAPSGDIRVDVFVEDETVWLTQKSMAELFGVEVNTVNYHLKEIFKNFELQEDSVIRKIRTTASDGKNYNTSFYNLDVIISVGYRVNSTRATQFRIWATQTLKEYILKGFALDDNRLKGNAGGNYWKELLDRIRDIRSSEKMLYRQVLDLYATSSDYDAKSSETIKFFKTVQNKLHYATSQQTAAEVIYGRADADEEFMGLTTFKGDLPVLNEVRIAKNYLTQDELFRLNRLVSAFFDLAEIKAKEHSLMRMKDWVEELDKFSIAFGKGKLIGGGSVSHEQAIEKAETEYKKYQVKTLSPVEKAYLDSLKQIENKAKKKLT